MAERHCQSAGHSPQSASQASVAVLERSGAPVAQMRKKRPSKMLGRSPTGRL